MVMKEDILGYVEEMYITTEKLKNKFCSAYLYDIIQN